MTKANNKAAVAVDDATSSITAVTDDDAMTLVDLFGDLDVEELTEPDNRTTSGESTSIVSSEVSTDVADREVDLKTKPSEKGKAADTESKVATEAETSSVVTSEAASSEVAESLASGETASEDKSTTDDASSKSGYASAGAQSSSAGEWTDSEDALIISMKEGGESWASIGNAINRGKNEVKKRWHVLKINVANSTESGGESIQTGSQADTEADDKTAVSQDEAKKADDDKYKSKAERKAERKAEKQKQKNNETPKADDKPKESQKPSKEVKITEGKKLEAKKSEPKPKEPRQRSKPSKPTPSESSSSKPATSDSNDETPSSSYRDRFNLLRDTSSASESTSSATSADENDADPQAKYERELVGQQRYIRRHVHPALYPPAPAASYKRKRPLPPPANRQAPSPADRQQRRDDATLAAVVSKREATKWLEMQANFFNATGRMVPLHMIKSRCEAEEDRGKAAGVRSWASSVAGSEDLLDPNEGRDAPEDALVDDDED
ncbi:hypothetical protein BDP81DRAFT_401689 [Colletotrichum phormii]|uniref:Myb-like domain-containing protein n=1 Tax=Colletotrichum phormii TaxID=359342 RepID=A0AAJ0EKX2_9PEZI|nr:uncharacterized protein BDP81DRAFT_401689 [Colletotrichum phormii]KAK1655651.1 hypothetical protein BDP81DRAFT_401689 [Colletotrichum phormii]